MKSKAAASFWKDYFRLPAHIQQLAYKNYQLWLGNVHHPSLRFKRFRNEHWSVRVGEHYRAVGFFLTRDTFVWTWIGSHEEYNKF